MSVPAEIKPEPLMARIEVTADEWAEIRMLAMREKTTTQKWIGSVLREKLAESAAAA